MARGQASQPPLRQHASPWTHPRSSRAFHPFTCLPPHTLFRPLACLLIARCPQPMVSGMEFLTHKPPVQGTLVNMSLLCEPRRGWWLSNRCPLLQFSPFPENKLFCCSGLLLTTSAFSLKKKKKVLNKPTRISWGEEHMLSNKTHYWPCFLGSYLRIWAFLKAPLRNRIFSLCCPANFALLVSGFLAVSILRSLTWLLFHAACVLSFKFCTFLFKIWLSCGISHAFRSAIKTNTPEWIQSELACGPEVIYSKLLFLSSFYFSYDGTKKHLAY